MVTMRKELTSLRSMYPKNWKAFASQEGVNSDLASILESGRMTDLTHAPYSYQWFFTMSISEHMIGDMKSRLAQDSNTLFQKWISGPLAHSSDFTPKTSENQKSAEQLSKRVRHFQRHAAMMVEVHAYYLSGKQMTSPYVFWLSTTARNGGLTDVAITDLSKFGLLMSCTTLTNLIGNEALGTYCVSHQ